MVVDAFELEERCEKAARILYAGNPALLLAGWFNASRRIAESGRDMPMVNALRNTLPAQQAQLQLDLTATERQVLQAALDDTRFLIDRHVECHRLLQFEKRAIITLAREMNIKLPAL